MRTRGYVLKVAIGCATLTACENHDRVGTVAAPPTAPTPEVMGTVGLPPDAVPDASAPLAVGSLAAPPVAPTPIGSAAPAPKPYPHKVGTIAAPPHIPEPTVGTTAQAPDSKP